MDQSEPLRQLRSAIDAWSTEDLPAPGVEPGGGSLIEAAVLLSFLLGSRNWLHRRSERYEVLDAVSVRCTISSEFTPPVELQSVDWVPLALINKAFIGKFEVRDEQGVGVPVLTRAESDGLGAHALAMLAEAVLDGSSPDAVTNEVMSVPHQKPGLAMDAVLRWHEEAHNSEYRDVWSKLLNANVFLAATRTLASNAVVFAAVPLEPGKRRIMGLSYELPLHNTGEPLADRFTRALGWRYHALQLELPGAGMARSYQLELVVPGEDLEFHGLALIGDRAVEYEADERGNRLFLSAHDPHPGHHILRTSLGARPGGFLRTSLLTTLLVCLLLGFGLARLEQVSKEVEAMTAVVGVLPALLIGLLVRQGEHGMATVLFAGLRRMLLLSVCCALGAVLALIGGYSGGTLRSIWTTAFALSALAFVAVLGSNVLPQRRRKLY